MTIRIIKGIGTAHTKLSAFDAALKDAGVYNYNLIYLSSIIPPRSKVEVVEKFNTEESEYGHKLYVVLAEERNDQVGKYIAAGVGWLQLDDGRGVFVEHHLRGSTEVAVRSEIELKIRDSVKDLCEFRGYEFNDERFKSLVSIAKVESKPTCALVVAVYQSEGWR